MRLFVDGVELTGWEDSDNFRPASLDMGRTSRTSWDVLDVPIIGAIPVMRDFQLAYGKDVQVTEDDGLTLRFRGTLAEPEIESLTGMLRWSIDAFDDGWRVQGAATGSLNKAGLVGLDRDWVIAIFRDCMQNKPFTPTGTLVTDRIITANEPSYPLVRATANVSGADWSYMDLPKAMKLLLDRVPGVTWRIRPDGLIQYGPPERLAPFEVADVPLVDLAVKDYGGDTLATAQLRAYHMEVRQDAPSGWWRLSERQGATVAIDSSGNGRHGTWVGTPSLEQRGLTHDSSSAATFDGVDDYVDIADHALFQTGSFTVEAWLALTAAPGSSILAKKTGANVGGFTLEWDGANYRLWVYIAGGWRNAGAGNWPDFLGRTHHLIGRYDGANIEVWIDKVRVAQTAFAGAMNAPAGATLRIGRDPTGGTPMVAQRAHEVAFYGYALPDVRIAAHLEAGRSAIAALDNGTYRESVLVGDHRNYFRLGGAGATEEIATDEASFARFGRILEVPYRDDPLIPAGDLRRLAFAELANRPIARRARFRIRRDGLEPGMILPVSLSQFEPAWLVGWPEIEFPLMARSDSGVQASLRGEFVVQKVAERVEAPGESAWDVEVGDYVRTFSTAVTEGEST